MAADWSKLITWRGHRAVFASLALLVAAGCEELQPLPLAGADRVTTDTDIQLAQASGGQSGSETTATENVSALLDPAPEIFEATGVAVWDGNRTLQGVWVAHPLAASARRVRIYNTANGSAVDGALFKRDAALSGAPVLISSEAAKLLGMSAGDEAELRIVAVKPAKRQAATAVVEKPLDQTETPVASEVKPAETATTEAPSTETATTETAAAVTTEAQPAAAAEDTASETAVAAAPQAPEKPAVSQPQPEKEPEAEPAERLAIVVKPPTPEEQTPKPTEAAQPKPTGPSPLRKPFV
ncbi:MAG: hypothetical protein AAF439_12410, partial [Pseudomonadota bacterium]